jgi:hypothetical protein
VPRSRSLALPSWTSSGPPLWWLAGKTPAPTQRGGRHVADSGPLDLAQRLNGVLSDDGRTIAGTAGKRQPPPARSLLQPDLYEFSGAEYLMRSSGPSLTSPTSGAYIFVPRVPSSGLKSRTVIASLNVPAGTLTVLPVRTIVA